MGKYPIRKCPDCKGSLVFIPLNSSIDFPNEYMLSNYICVKCSKKNSNLKQISFNFAILSDHKEKGKFPSALKYSQKIKRVVDRTKNLESRITSKKPPKQYCMYCKDEIYYDKDASQINSDFGLNVRVYFHFDCYKTKIHQTFYFIIRGFYDGIEFVRVVQG